MLPSKKFIFPKHKINFSETINKKFFGEKWDFIHKKIQNKKILVKLFFPSIK